MEKTYIWGTGKIAEYIFHFYNDKLSLKSIVGCIDNSKEKQGKLFHSIPIFTPSVLENDKDCSIIILAAAYEEISNQILKDYPWLKGKIESPLLFTRQRLISRYENANNEEISDVISYLKNNPLQVFNYEFASKYDERAYDVLFDEDAELHYIVIENKRMYFAKYLNSKEKVQKYCKQIMMEQDKDSPHRYLTESFQVKEDSVVIDAGVAEGNFALSVIDKVKKVYLFEPDSEWVDALKYTFASYADKVVIINKYLSNYTDESTVSLDVFLQGEKVDFIKMDIEGEEYHALEGAINVISSSNKLKCAICSYHQENDYIALSYFLQDCGFRVEPSKGYMWFPYDKDNVYSLPTLRRGLIRAEKD